METMEVRTEFVMDLNYVVIMNDGVNKHFAEAGFRNKWKAITYAEQRTLDYDEYNPSDSAEVHSSALVAHFDVVLVHGDERDEEWETVHETNEFYFEP